MHTTLVHVHVKPEHLDAFIAATKANHENSIREAGNRRFDILQSKDDPCYFVFYEAYNSPDDVLAHRETAHYRTWREQVADWMTEPRKGIVFNGLFPA
ncbi:MAG TPA: antibiotic biosynthesis monooxygenase [Verrucomicrobia bacterium]|nr:MAG: antibiotic biosynthesis monooxygenase [Lentisphaerae bacterium GWF2_57_35]HBA83146.1 antibiotic biosynthesis monooxygenase [Verrucomicrobiota bacterium]